MTELFLQKTKSPPAEDPDEQRLVDAAQRQPAAFAALYDRYLVRIYRYLLNRVGNTTDAEDLTSQVFLDALRALPRYQPTAPFAAWLFAIARRRLADHHRKPAPATPMNTELDAQTGQDEPLLDMAIKSEDLAHLAAEVAALPEDERDLIKLRYSAGLTFREIADLLGRKEDAVKKALYRLLERLEGQMEMRNDR